LASFTPVAKRRNVSAAKSSLRSIGALIPPPESGHQEQGITSKPAAIALKSQHLRRLVLRPTQGRRLE
jgi:hypothetical protein